MNAIEIINDYMGEKLTTQIAERLSNAPHEHIVNLVEKLSFFYYNWLENEEKKNTLNDKKQRFFCIDPFNSNQEWTQQLEIYKKHLLYFPSFTVPDPLASFLWPHITMASFFGEIVIDDDFLLNFRMALTLLAELAPAINDADIMLIPMPFANDYSSVQEGARMDLKAIKELGAANYYEPLYNEANKYSINKDGIHMMVDSMKVQGQLCNRLNLTPVAGSSIIKKALMQDYERGIKYLSATNSTHRVTETMLKYEVPGLKKVSFQRIVELRKNESAFEDWRIQFGNILNKVYSEQPIDDSQFEREFKEAADNNLIHKIKELKKATSSSVLEKIFFPAALTIGAGTAVFYAANNSFPLGPIASAAVTPVGWVLDKLNKRYNRGGRKAALISEFYGYLTDK